jgi:uncharacterized membrane protein YgcG
MMPIGSSTKQRRSPKAAGESVAQVPTQRAQDQEVAPPASIQLSLVCLPGKSFICCHSLECRTYNLGSHAHLSGRSSMCQPVGGGGGSSGDHSGGGGSGGGGGGEGGGSGGSPADKSGSTFTMTVRDVLANGCSLRGSRFTPYVCMCV